MTHGPISIRFEVEVPDFCLLVVRFFPFNLLNCSCNYSYVPTRAVARFQTSAFCTCGGPSGTGTGVSRRSTAVLPYKRNCTNAPYSNFVHILYVLYRERSGIYIK